ncbi:MAG: hypothetical protein ACKOVH_09100 [Actinomycetota bacterium]
MSRRRRPLVAGSAVALVTLIALVTSGVPGGPGPLADAPPAGATPRTALAPGTWEVSFSWAGTASDSGATVTSSSQFLGNGIGTLLVDADSVAGPFGIAAVVSGRGTAVSASGARATGDASGATWTFTGTFGGSATQPCLTGEVGLGGTFVFEDRDGLAFIPLEDFTFPLTCGDWPLRLASVRCNVFEGEWVWARTNALSALGYRFGGSPSRVWGVRAGRSDEAARAAADAMAALTQEAEALASSSPLAVEDLRAFLRAARTRLPRAAAACDGASTDVALQVFTRVLIANLLGQGAPLGPDALTEVADFAARVGAFGRPRSELSSTTLAELDAALLRLVDDPTATEPQLADAADAADRLGLARTRDRLDQEAALRARPRR